MTAREKLDSWLRWAAVLLLAFIAGGLTLYWLGRDAVTWWGRLAGALTALTCALPALATRKREVPDGRP